MVYPSGEAAMRRSAAAGAGGEPGTSRARWLVRTLLAGPQAGQESLVGALPAHRTRRHGTAHSDVLGLLLGVVGGGHDLSMRASLEGVLGGEGAKSMALRASAEHGSSLALVQLRLRDPPGG